MHIVQIFNKNLPHEHVQQQQFYQETLDRFGLQGELHSRRLGTIKTSFFPRLIRFFARFQFRVI